MYGDFSEKLAKLVVNYAVNVRSGDLVQIRGAANADDLLCDIYREVIIAGGKVIKMDVSIPGLQEIFFKYASDDQLTFVDSSVYDITNRVNKSISIYSSFNTRALTNIDAKKRALVQKANKEIFDLFYQRVNQGELDWILCPYPCQALAQEASMGIKEYQEFVYKALALDKPNPVKYWLTFEKEQDKIIKILEKGKEMRIIGEDTDIVFGIENRKWINCCGHENLPDGEVFTAPIEDKVNGTIRFSYPGIYMGQEVENIWLKFKDGQVVGYDAAKGKELLETILN